MNNEPVAWMLTDRVVSSVPMEGAIPLYTHPVKEDEGKVCARCGAIAYDPVITQTVKELTDEEIEELWYDPRFIGDPVAFGKAVLRATKNIPLQTDEEICKKCDALTERAILRKASEK